MSIEIIPPHSRWDEHCRELGIKLGAISTSDKVFEKLLELRKDGYANRRAGELESVDAYSEHYVALVKGELHAALRVTRASAGPLEIEDYIPPSVLGEHRRIICNASRFVSNQSVRLESRIPQLLIETAWIDELRRGIRLDVIGVSFESVGYYGRLGYHLLSAVPFTHGLRGKQCCVMAFCANACVSSPIAPVFADTPDGFTTAQLAGVTGIQCWKEFRRNLRKPEQLAS